MESTANWVKYFVEYHQMEMVLGTLLYVILVIIAIVIIILLLRFLFQLFFVIPVGSDYHTELLYAKEILLSLNS
jgi:hypothetical protein